MNKRVTIVDCTLRDGEQAPGVAFGAATKLQLLRLLIQAGVDAIEAGIPAMGPHEAASFAALVREGGPTPIIAWNRMKRSDIDSSLATGCRHLHISLPVSTVMLKDKLSIKPGTALQLAEECIVYARSKGAQVYIGAEDASRADPAFLADFFTLAETLGVIRIRYADTVGCLTPRNVERKLVPLTARLRVPLEFHGHNDFGLASANSLAAIESGASAVSATVLGLGERAGNASLEQLASALELLGIAETSMVLQELPSLCSAVAEASGRTIPSDKPLVGSDVFTHESGIHVDGLLKNQSMYTPFPPELLGREHRFVPGKHSGSGAVKHLAQSVGYQPDEKETARILEEIAEKWNDGPPEDPDTTFLDIVRHNVSNGEHKGKTA